LRFYQSNNSEPLISFSNLDTNKRLDWLDGERINTRHPSWGRILEGSLQLANNPIAGKKPKKKWNSQNYRAKLMRQHKTMHIIAQNFRPYWLGSTYRGKSGAIIPIFIGIGGYLHSTPLHSHHVPNLAYAFFAQTASFLENDLLGAIDTIGPHRQQPERHYVYSGNVPDRVGSDGSNMPDILFKNDKNLLTRLNKRMAQLDLPYKIQKHQEGESDVFSIDVCDQSTGMTSSVADVGFGLSQVLPILVQVLQSSDSILCVEQPEIHLHPALQARLGDIFIESAMKRNNTFILETHSEHLILRLLRRIREGMGKKNPKLRKEDLCVLYVEPLKQGSRVIEMEIDDDGDFVNVWPGGFFEEAYEEKFAGR
jgi:hypothetical protein